ncbi:hypothetical protein BC332_24074 [Capsicum chinense]|nr:hypothetical protein BC332_24074 [Capsicum chinense]
MALQIFLSLYIIFFIAFTSCPQVFISSPTVASDVQFLLQNIKSLLQGSTNNLLLSSWNTSVPLYQCRGLKYVFSNVILSGTLPRELGELSTLQSLYLGVNPLHGTIPLELDYNFSRSDIELSGNTLSGTLPSSIWNICEKLVSLKIYGNYLSGSLPNPALPDATCKSLQYLDFGQNIFSGNFPMLISKF